MSINGNRIYPDEDGKFFMPELSYGQDQDGVWWCRPPDCHSGMLTDHEVAAHEDGTITVSPSIDLPGIWHGYLRRGVWTEC